MRKLLCCVSMERELHIPRKVVQELLKTSKALMERLTKWMDLNSFLSLSGRMMAMILIVQRERQENGGEQM